MLASYVSLGQRSLSVIHTEAGASQAGDLGYVAVKHALSTLFIELTPSASY